MQPLMTPAQVAELLAVSSRTVRRLAESGELPGLRIGSQWRFREQTVRAWVADREAAADWERDSATSSRTEVTSAPAADTVARRPVSLPVGGGLPRDYAPVFPALWGETASNAALPAAGRARSTRTQKRAT